MKKILSTLLIGFTLSTASFAQSGNDALKYMQQMSTEFQQIQSATWDYTKSVAKIKEQVKLKKIDMTLKRQSKIRSQKFKNYQDIKVKTISVIQCSHS